MSDRQPTASVPGAAPASGCALGVDLALRDWASCGLAAVRWRDGRWTGWRTRFPRPDRPLDAEAVAAWVDGWARRLGACAVGLDGPASWRDPATSHDLPGVGRRADYAVRAQAKVGAWGTVYPSTQRGWTEFCVDVFSALLERPGVRLVATDPPGPRPDAYWVSEVFPTACWRERLAPSRASAGSTQAGIARCARARARPTGSPRRRVLLRRPVGHRRRAPGGGPRGGPAESVPLGALLGGRPPRRIPAHRVEGYVLNATPRPRRRRGSSR
ncbi:MAG: hypothetical protein R3F62_26005 [Planctomycetota bacterium]